METTVRKMNWKKACAIVLAAMLLLLGIPQAKAASLPVKPAPVEKASEGCVLLGVEGTYYSEAEKALARINEIRREACKEGVKNPNTGKPLTMADYVPLKWSSDLEYIARIRAAEASICIAHERPNGQMCFSVRSPGGEQSWAEDLAWNFSKGMLQGIEQWYGEKTAWVKNTGGVTGHYTSMIDPEYRYIGLGTFYVPGARFANATAAELSFRTGLDETISKSTGKCIQTVEVRKDAVTAAISGKTSLAAGTTETLTLKATAKLTNATTSGLRVLGGISWKSSNTDVVQVDAKGKITAKAPGTATVTAKSESGIKASKKITVTKASADKTTAKAPAKPGSVKAATAGVTSVKLSWKKVSGASGYEVYRATSKAGKYRIVAAISKAATVRYTDKKLTTGKTYYYKVRAYKTSGKTKVYSGYSAIVSAKAAPVKPAGVKATAGAKNTAKVSWKKVSGATGYEVYRATSKSGKYSKITTIKKGSTVSFTDKKLKTGKTYYYKVRAYKTSGKTKVYGAYSDIKSAKAKK